MARRRISSIRVQEDSRGFQAGLSSAILEWLLIFLLFVDALFAYLLTKFARYCQLQTPCLLCSRLDHVLGNEKQGFYWDLICCSHKLEISSLVVCQCHDKLADIHGMCDGCLNSFTKDKKPNAETYKLLVGKLGKNHECCVHKDPLKHHRLGYSREKNCSCCNEPWKLSSYSTHRYLLNQYISPEVSELNAPLPGYPNIFDGLKRKRGRSSGLMASSHLSNLGFDLLSHIGYTELKITSDSESEVLLSDDDDESAVVRETDDLKEQVVPHRVQPDPHTSGYILLTDPSDISPLDKLNDQNPVHIPSLSVPNGQLDVCNPYHVNSSSSSIAAVHGLEELNWQKVEQKPGPPALSELISLYDIPSSPNTSAALTRETSVLDAMGIGDLVLASTSETGGVCISERGLASLGVVEHPRATLDVQGTGDIGQVADNGEMYMSENASATLHEPHLKSEMSKEPGSPMNNLMDLADAYRSAVGNKGGQASGILREHLTVKDSVRGNEDLKLLLSQIPPTRGLELSLSDMSPKFSGFGEELNISDVSGFIGSLSIPKRPSFERNESGFESLDGSIVSEVDGESVVDRLKRQVEYDRKSMSALYKELEEERNASAIAANQAMAMITRLQEEKASLHMEALQYLRMMEEQAEYDVEALQKANDLLAEKEKEIQDMEAELDIYKNLQDGKMEEKIQGSYEFVLSDMRMEHSKPRCIGSSINGSPRTPRSSKDSNRSENIDVGHKDSHVNINDSVLSFEDERLYISQCLKKLENMLIPCSENGVPVDVANGGYSGNKAHGLDDQEHHHCEEVTQGNRQMEEDMLSMQKASPPSREGLILQERNSPLAGEPQSENIHFDGPDSSITSIASLENEVLDLNERLEALEEDRNFLTHTINSLRNGDEGLKYIQEIAVHLRELRSIGLRRREKDVA